MGELQGSPLLKVGDDMGRKPKVTEAIFNEINKLYYQGYTMAQIGKKLNLGHSTVNKYVVNPRQRGETFNDFLRFRSF